MYPQLRGGSWFCFKLNFLGSNLKLKAVSLSQGCINYAFGLSDISEPARPLLFFSCRWPPMAQRWITGRVALHTTSTTQLIYLLLTKYIYFMDRWTFMSVRSSNTRGLGPIPCSPALFLGLLRMRSLDRETMWDQARFLRPRLISFSQNHDKKITEKLLAFRTSNWHLRRLSTSTLLLFFKTRINLTILAL